MSCQYDEPTEAVLKPYSQSLISKVFIENEYRKHVSEIEKQRW